MPLKVLPTRDDEKFGPLVVNAVLTGIVADKSEGYRYTDEDGGRANCVYRNEDGSPSCLVGHVAHRLGIPLPAYDAFENSTGVCSTVLGQTYFTTDALSRLSRVQMRQDSGETWARAIR